MENSYKRLRALVEDGDLSITYIDSPPRTVSSALFRSLSQVMPACAYEPFHNSADNFKAGLEVLLNKAIDAGVYSARTRKPIRLVAKEIARYLPDDAWIRWTPLVTYFIVLVRDPFLQLESLLRRAANDLHYGRYGASGLIEDQVWEMSEQVANIFEHGGSIAGQRIPANFERASWQSLRAHVENLSSARYSYEHHERRLCIVDSFLLRAIPEQMMAELLEFLQIEGNTTSITRTVSQWSAETASDLARPNCPEDDAYRKKAQASTGYTLPLDETPILNKFPQAFQRHLREQALPIYLDILRQPNRVGPKTPPALASVFNIEIHGTKLLKRNPVSAYSLMASLINERLTNTQRLQQLKELTAIRKEVPEHAETFRLIDQIVVSHQQKEQGNRQLSCPAPMH